MSRSADLAVLGARIRTMDPDRPFAEAVAIRDGIIVAVGDDATVREACDASTELVDGAGTALVPGLTDSHVHPVWGAELAQGVELTGATTLAAVRERLAAERERLGPDAWLRGWSLDYAAFPDGIEWAHVAEAAGDGPALLLFYDLHTALASPAAFAAAEIDGPVEFDDASEVVCRDGVPTGELLELSAYHLILAAAPAVTAQQEREQFLDVLRRFNAAGLTGGHNMDGAIDTLAWFHDLEGDGDLPFRMVVPLWLTPAVTDGEIAIGLHLRDVRGRRFRGGVAKLFIDGVVDTGTAWLYEPDTEGAGTEPFWRDPQRYADVVHRFAAAGFQCVTHAIGDKAVGAVIDAYQRAAPAVRGLHRIEHLETLTDADLARLPGLGAVASMQPLHMQWREADGSDSWATRLGPERVARAFRTGDLLRAGVPMALGSDWPVASFDPRLGMAWARLRRRPGDRDADPFEPDQRLTAEQALAGYTTWAAAAVGESGVAGRVAEGLRADLTGLAADPVETDADELPNLPVRLTVVDGEVVHRSDD